jgi:hypothetical protein
VNDVYVASNEKRCPQTCPHGDRCRLDAGHEKEDFEGTDIPVGCSHLHCPCNLPNVDPNSQ